MCFFLSFWLLVSYLSWVLILGCSPFVPLLISEIFFFTKIEFYSFNTIFIYHDYGHVRLNVALIFRPKCYSIRCNRLCELRYAPETCDFRPNVNRFVVAGSNNMRPATCNKSHVVENSF